MNERCPLTANVLFSGIGCQERGIQNTGLFDLKVLATSDISKEAILTYAAIHCGLTEELIDTYSDYPPAEIMINELTHKNIGYNPEKRTMFNWSKYLNKPQMLKKYWLAVHLSNNFGDISRIDRLPYADLWTSSFPCTDISCSGKLKGLKPDSNTRSSLLWHTIRLLRVARDENILPKFIMFENVKNLVGKTFYSDFCELLELLDDLGFNVYWSILNAKKLGIPQNRERVFVLCIRKDTDNHLFEFPREKPLKFILNDIADQNADERYYLDTKKTNALIEAFISRCGSENLFPFGSNDDFSVCCVAMRGRYKENPSLRISGLPTEQRLEIGPSAGVISNAITTVQKDSLLLERRRTLKEKGIYFTDGIYDYRVRKYTPEEGFVLMGLTPQDVQNARAVGVCDTYLNEQAGNGIVTSCVEELFRCIYECNSFT